MPDQRKHRGPHPEDSRLFAPAAWPRLRQAVQDMSWLLNRGYGGPSTLKLVGDRYELDARQRVAVSRCAFADQQVADRSARQVQPADLVDQQVWIDGYNVLTSLEAALAGGVILLGRDEVYRDMASMHGSYRKVEETLPALELLGEVLSRCQVAGCHWLLDQPVSNSGRLAALLREFAEARGLTWQAELVPDPDAVLIGTDAVVASADRQILDQTQRWLNLARLVIDLRVPNPWIVDLSGAD